MVCVQEELPMIRQPSIVHVTGLLAVVLCHVGLPGERDFGR